MMTKINNKKYRRDSNTMPQWAGSCWYYIAYILKKQGFDRGRRDNELPQSAKDVISQNIVVKNGSKAVPFNDVFDKLVVSNLSGFPQNPATPIPAIDIEIKIKEGPLVLLQVQLLY